ncbi:gas vesicle protein [Streptomyces sp. enrichment culture]|uniref:gas vesicle protein n=1 Tax=Streptomyces sp. enrichment culture TaxID=1795815 RepID=UPI003F55697D
MTEYGEYGAYGAGGGQGRAGPVSGTQVALIDLLDRLLSGGVVITGDLVISVADIDLVRVSLRALVVAVREQAEEQWTALPQTRGTGQGGHRELGR